MNHRKPLQKLFTFRNLIVCALIIGIGVAISSAFPASEVASLLAVACFGIGSIPILFAAVVFIFFGNGKK